jgi:hypothetical protein
VQVIRPPALQDAAGRQSARMGKARLDALDASTTTSTGARLQPRTEEVRALVGPVPPFPNWPRCRPSI